MDIPSGGNRVSPAVQADSIQQRGGPAPGHPHRWRGQAVAAATPSSKWR
ncbi:hypothetical protein SSCG_03212 [Streptomyces clavuligerus]|nr:hypothetical protein SSCG_03212 [Streptomyces clavuligerus]